MITAIIQARMGSTRLPGKVMLDLAGKPVLWHVVNRVKQARYIDNVIVATTRDEKDTVIVDYCKNIMKVSYYAGSEEDVLDRYYQAASANGMKAGDTVVRITADCPLADPVVIDHVITAFLVRRVDYACNTNPPTYPDGLDVEVFTYEALSEAWQKASLQSEREHVTPYIRKQSQFQKENITNSIDLSMLRWTLDEEEDYQAIKQIYEALYQEEELFYTCDICDLLEANQEIVEINKKYQRNEGYIKSLKNDKIVL